MPTRRRPFVRRLSEYAPELDEALRRVRSAGARDVVVSAHSTGGLVAALALHHRRDDPTVRALVLNSPFLDLPGSWWERQVATAAALVGRRPAVRRAAEGGARRCYAAACTASTPGSGTSTSASRRSPASRPGSGGCGPSGRPGLRTPWPRPRHPGARPCAARSVRPREWTEDLRSADAVLDADRIATLAPRLGREVTVVRFEGGLHDLALSTRKVREQVYAETERWLDARGRRRVRNRHPTALVERGGRARPEPADPPGGPDGRPKVPAALRRSRPLWRA